MKFMENEENTERKMNPCRWCYIYFINSESENVIKIIRDGQFLSGSGQHG